MDNIKREYWSTDGDVYEKLTEYNKDGSIKEIIQFKNNIVVKIDKRNQNIRKKIL